MTKNKKGQEEYPGVKQSKHQTPRNTYDPPQIPDQKDNIYRPGYANPRS